MILEILFIFFLFIPIYSYIFYPAIIWVVSRFITPINASNEDLSVSIILSVYNEEKVIGEKIKNLANLKYDFDLLEVLVGSDASDDETEKILSKMQSEYEWLRVYTFSDRRGKSFVLNDLIKECKSEIIVFTDANSMFQKDSIKKLVEKFSSDSIGGVSGRLILKEPKKNNTYSNEERRYWEYETFIKKAEGRCGTLIGANGGIFAIRKDFFTSLPKDKVVTDDLFLTMAILQKGEKFCYAEDAIAYEEIAPTISDEFNRKIRFSTTNFSTLKLFGFVLKGASFLTNYCYFSHKILRWFIPIILVVLPIVNIFLFSDSIFYKVTFYIQLLFILLALTGAIFSKIKIRFTIFSIPYFFMISNIAIILGGIRFLIGNFSGIWQPTPRE